MSAPLPEPAASPFTSPVVLVVEDCPDSGAAVVRVLKKHGLDAVHVTTARAAMQWLSLHRPAVVLVDVHLPDLNGLILTSQIRQVCGSDLPILVISGDTRLETINALPHVGGTLFVGKPVNATRLAEQVRRMVYERTASDTASSKPSSTYFSASAT
jgi:DNA-binding response OmpR family regulator